VRGVSGAGIVELELVEHTGYATLNYTSFLHKVYIYNTSHTCFYGRFRQEYLPSQHAIKRVFDKPLLTTIYNLLQISSMISSVFALPPMSGLSSLASSKFASTAL